MRTILLLGIVLLLVPSGIAAQRIEANPGANCSGVLTSTLASGREHRDLHSCAAQIIPELAHVIRNAGTNPDTARLILLHRLVYQVRDPSIFSAGLDLAKQRGTAPAARVLGLYVALTQFRANVSFTTLGVSRPFSVPLSEYCREISFTNDHPERFPHDNGLPPGAETMLDAVTADLAASDAEPLMVRRFARCVRVVLPYEGEVDEA